MSHMQQSPTLYELLWEAMDNAYAQLMDARPKSRGADELKGKCRGLAEALTIFSAPRTLGWVRDETVRRWETGQTNVDSKTLNKRELRRQP